MQEEVIERSQKGRLNSSKKNSSWVKKTYSHLAVIYNINRNRMNSKNLALLFFLAVLKQKPKDCLHCKAEINIRKNIFACLFIVYNTISLSRHEQACLMRLSFEIYFSHHRADDGRSISRNLP